MRGGVKIQVGSIEHLMLDKHSIRLIEVLTKNKVFHVELSQSEKLEAGLRLKS